MATTARTAAKEDKAAVNEQIEGQTEVPVNDAPAAEEPQAPKAAASTARNRIILYSKGDVAEIVEMSTQALANKASRDEAFPRPTYSNESGTVELYTKDDLTAIIDYLDKPARERKARLDAKLKKLGAKK